MIDFSKLDDIEFDNINYRDAMDFSDAFICRCLINDNEQWREATEEELDEINDDSDFVYEELLKQMF
jgi:hypothetical protein